MDLVYFYFYSHSLSTVQFQEIPLLHTLFHMSQQSTKSRSSQNWQMNHTCIQQQYCLQRTLVASIQHNSHSLWFHWVSNKETRQLCTTSNMTLYCNAQPLISFKFDFDTLVNPHHGLQICITNPNLSLSTFLSHLQCAMSTTTFVVNKLDINITY